MKQFRLGSLIFTLIVLSSAIGRADDSIRVQIIDDMYKAGTLTTQASNTVGITKFVTYTVSGASTAKFWDNGGYISICLPNKWDYVTTSLIPNLKSVEFSYMPSTDYLDGAYPTMQIQISEDSLDWSTDLTSIATHGKNTGGVALPVPGDYYLRIKNTGSSTPVYIRSMTYTTQHCNCFRYRP